MPARAIDSAALRNYRMEQGRMRNQWAEDAWSKSLIDKVVELQSPRSKARWSVSEPAEDSSNPPCCLIGIAAKIKYAEERVEWLVNQIEDCQLHLLNLPDERAAELERLHEEVQAVARSCTIEASTELVAIKHLKELDLHELRAEEMPICDEFYETRDRIRRSVDEIDSIRSALHQSTANVIVAKNDASDDARPRVNTEVWVSARQPEDAPWTPGRTPKSKKQVITQKPVGMSEERWELLQLRQEAEKLEWELEVIRKTLALAREELANELKQANEDAKHKILLIHEDKYNTVTGAMHEKQKMCAEKREDIEKMKLNVEAAKALEQDVNFALQSWKTAQLLVGQWVDRNLQIRVRVSNGHNGRLRSSSPGYSSPLLEKLGVGINDAHTSPVVPSVSITGCQKYQPGQFQLYSAAIRDGGLSFSVKSPLGVQEWRLVPEQQELVGYGGFAEKTPRRFTRSDQSNAHLSPSSAAAVRAKTYRIVMNQA